MLTVVFFNERYSWSILLYMSWWSLVVYSDDVTLLCTMWRVTGAHGGWISPAVSIFHGVLDLNKELLGLKCDSFIHIYMCVCARKRVCASFRACACMCLASTDVYSSSLFLVSLMNIHIRRVHQEYSEWTEEMCSRFFVLHLLVIY